MEDVLQSFKGRGRTKKKKELYERLSKYAGGEQRGDGRLKHTTSTIMDKVSRMMTKFVHATF